MLWARVGSIIFAALLPLAGAITINTPQNVLGNTSLVVSWTAQSGDPPVITFELEGPSIPDLGISVNTITASGNFSVELPDDIPAGAGYKIVAVDPGNLDTTIGSSGNFTIAQHDATTSTASTPGPSSTSGTTGTSSAVSTSSSPALQWLALVLAFVAGLSVLWL